MSRLQVVPPVVTLYPNDRQLFTAQCVPPPAMWQGVTDGGDVGSDFSLAVDALGSQTGAFGAHDLRSGIGSVEITIDDQCRPTGGGGKLIITGLLSDISGPLTYSYAINIAATAVQVVIEGAVTVYSESYSTVSGDIYKMELAAGFRLYRNGVLLHSRVNLPTQVIYPQLYAVNIIETTAVAPTRIPPPRLVGDWRLRSVVSWSGISHGVLSDAGPSISTQYSGGITPGTYTLIGSIDSASDSTGAQRAVALITIPPLIVLGNLTNITLQPGQKVRFKTNYDAAQTPGLVVWSVVSGGGSFSKGEFTAPNDAGTTVIRATVAINSQIADITITVPAVITPDLAAAAPGDRIDWLTNLTEPLWTASDGAINPGTGLWTVPEGTDRTVQITATRGASTVTRTVEIVDKFPLNDPSLPVVWDRNLTAVISVSEDRTSRSSREKSPPYDSYEIKFISRTLDECNEVDDFFDAHGFGKLFILEDTLRGIRKAGWFDSIIHHEGNDQCAIDLSFRFLEARF
jgi:hypothetical protein